MPKGMFLKSEGCASNLSDPEGSYPLKQYCEDEALPRYLRQRGLTFHEWGPSHKVRRELARFCTDDPVPFVMMCIRLLLRVVERMLRMRPAGETVNTALPWMTSRNRCVPRSTRRAV